MSSRASLLSAAIPGSIAALLTTAWVVACGTSSDTVKPAPATDSGVLEGGAEAGTETPEQLFRDIQPALIEKCGGTNGACHVMGSFSHAPTWLGPPDPYVSAKGYKGIIPVSGDPSDSILLTQMEHEGPSLQSSPDLFGKARAWIQAEIGNNVLPETAAISISSGVNTIDLSTLGMNIPGARLTFIASSNNNILTLTSMKIYASSMGGLHIDSPFFVIVPAKGPVIADPLTNGFSGTQDIAASTSQDFYSGQIILLNWADSSQLRLAFKSFGPLAVQTVDAGPTGECTALDSFVTNAVPAFNASVPLSEGGTSTCYTCHSGGDQVAMNAMDLSKLGTDNAAACAQVRNEINFADKPNSTLILNPQGKTSNQHPVNSLTATDPVVVGLQTWVNAEQQ